jgi:hypothetical protein
MSGLVVRPDHNANNAVVRVVPGIRAVWRADQCQQHDDRGRNARATLA